MIWRRWARAGIAALLYYSGFVPLLIRRRLRKRAVALMYHRVLPAGALDACPSHPAIVVSLETFERQIDWLCRFLRPVPLSEVERRLSEGEEFDDRTCLVTFDDGWADNFRFAAPVLRSRRVPAAVFLSTGFVGTDDRFWQERIVAALTWVRGQVEADPALRESVAADPALSKAERLLSLPRSRFRGALGAFVSSLKSSPASEVRSVVAAAENLVGDEPATTGPDFLDWSQVREMADCGIEFGAHGVRHRILTHPETDVGAEVIGSRDALRDRLGRSPLSFCYPNGNHDEDVAAVVRRGGFSLAFTTRSGYISAGSDPYTLPRISIHEGVCSTIPLFAGRIAGLW